MLSSDEPAHRDTSTYKFVKMQVVAQLFFVFVLFSLSFVASNNFKLNEICGIYTSYT